LLSNDGERARRSGGIIEDCGGYGLVSPNPTEQCEEEDEDEYSALSLLNALGNGKFLS